MADIDWLKRRHAGFRILVSEGIIKGLVVVDRELNIIPKRDIDETEFPVTPMNSNELEWAHRLKGYILAVAMVGDTADPVNYRVLKREDIAKLLSGEFSGNDWLIARTMKDYF